MEKLNTPFPNLPCNQGHSCEPVLVNDTQQRPNGSLMGKLFRSTEVIDTTDTVPLSFLAPLKVGVMPGAEVACYDNEGEVKNILGIPAMKLLKCRINVTNCLLLDLQLHEKIEPSFV